MKRLLLARPESPPVWWPRRAGGFAWVTLHGDGWTLSRERKYAARSTRQLEDRLEEFADEYEQFDPILYRIVEV